MKVTRQSTAAADARGAAAAVIEDNKRSRVWAQLLLQF
jgi:hypothetical protein